MGYRSQSGPRHRSGEKFQKSSHAKAKPKPQKPRPDIKYAPEEVPVLSSQEVADKTTTSLNRLGTQTFALSPYSQYYDDWLMTLQQLISEFESNPAISVDQDFKNARTQIFADVESELAKQRLFEAELEATASALAENNHRLVETDATYAAQTRELGNKRNREINELTKNVSYSEEALSRIQQEKTSRFGFTKSGKAKKDAVQQLNAAKSELELAVQNYKIEQDKMHDEYTKKKQALIQKVQSLEKAIVDTEKDRSVEARLTACKALADAVNALLLRKPAAEPANPP
jgi:hypothetical protein